jgi:hypothetical protein
MEGILAPPILSSIWILKLALIVSSFLYNFHLYIYIDEIL